MFETGKAPAAIVQEKGLAQVSDTGAIEKICDEVIAANPGPAADFKAGKVAALNFLKGQVMKLSKGKANPGVAGEILERKLKIASGILGEVEGNRNRRLSRNPLASTPRHTGFSVAQKGCNRRQRHLIDRTGPCANATNSASRKPQEAFGRRGGMRQTCQFSKLS